MALIELSLVCNIKSFNIFSMAARELKIVGNFNVFDEKIIGRQKKTRQFNWKFLFTSCTTTLYKSSIEFKSFLSHFIFNKTDARELRERTIDDESGKKEKARKRKKFLRARATEWEMKEFRRHGQRWLWSIAQSFTKATTSTRRNGEEKKKWIESRAWLSFPWQVSSSVSSKWLETYSSQSSADARAQPRVETE